MNKICHKYTKKRYCHMVVHKKPCVTLSANANHCWTHILRVGPTSKIKYLIWPKCLQPVEYRFKSVLMV